MFLPIFITNNYDDYISSSEIVCSNAIIFSETYKFDTVCLAGWSISSIRAITVCLPWEMLLLPSNNSIKKIAFFQDLIATWRTDSIGLQRRRPELEDLFLYYCYYTTYFNNVFSLLYYWTTLLWPHDEDIKELLELKELLETRQTLMVT